MKPIIRTVTFAIFATLALPAMATLHEVPCPVCGLKVVQATKEQDNEVVLRYGKKKIEYRCVFCALSDAKKYADDLVIYAPSEKKGEPVILQRTGGKWSAVKALDGKLVPEEGAVFVNGFKNHDECAMLSRAFHSKAAFEKYAAKIRAKDLKPLTLDEMVAKVTS